jgi:hypothetical protein
VILSVVVVILPHTDRNISIFLNIIFLLRARLITRGLEEDITDSACFKLLFMRELLLTGYHFDKESYERIQV